MPNDYELDETICPFCGAASKRRCDLREEMGCCPWEESEDDNDPNDGTSVPSPTDPKCNREQDRMMSNAPRLFDLQRPEERARLLREVGGYLKTSAFYHEGTDSTGRAYAGAAMLRALDLGYSLAPPAPDYVADAVKGAQVAPDEIG